MKENGSKMGTASVMPPEQVVTIGQHKTEGVARPRLLTANFRCPFCYRFSKVYVTLPSCVFSRTTPSLFAGALLGLQDRDASYGVDEGRHGRGLGATTSCLVKASQ